MAVVKSRLGSVEAAEQVEVWADLPRSTVGEVVQPEARGRLLPRSAAGP